GVSTPGKDPHKWERLSLTFTDKMTYIIETPFSHIPAAFVVALRNSATKVKNMALFCHRQIFNGFPLPVFYFRRCITLHLHQ
ncbi:TPA: hypothetical protein ACIYPD_005324, partial [Escherichia coli]